MSSTWRWASSIGTAFGKIVNSLVNDVVMPPIGILINDVDFKSLAVTLKHGPDAKTTVTLNYGNFIQTVVEFVIIAWFVFLWSKRLTRSVGWGRNRGPALRRTWQDAPEMQEPRGPFAIEHLFLALSGTGCDDYAIPRRYVQKLRDCGTSPFAVRYRNDRDVRSNTMRRGVIVFGDLLVCAPVLGQTWWGRPPPSWRGAAWPVG